jgi:hypothetical protein
MDKGPPANNLEQRKDRTEYARQTAQLQNQARNWNETNKHKRHKTTKTIDMDYKKIDNIEIDGIDFKDYPDFSNAYIVSADYDGKPMTDDQLEQINNDGQFQYEAIMNDLQ